MSCKRIFAIVLRQFFLLRSSFTRVIPLFVWVGIDIVLWGFITKYLNQVNNSGFNFIPAMLGAVLLWGFLVRVMHGVTMAFLEDVWSRNFLNIFASPLTTGEYMTGLIITSIFTSLVGLLSMIILASCVFGLSLFAYGMALLPFLLILFLFGIALGVAATSVVLRYGPAAEWFIWPIPALISPFVGVFYPLSVLPQWMQLISKCLPPAYVFESIRSIIHGGQMAGDNLLLGLSLAVAYVIAGVLIFQRVFAHALRTGLIARYSAENVA